MNLQQQERFYQMMIRLKTNSRAGSVPKEDTIVTEIVNGLIVSKPAKRIEHISEPAAKTREPQAEAQVWNLTKGGLDLESTQPVFAFPVLFIVNKFFAFILFYNSGQAPLI